MREWVYDQLTGSTPIEAIVDDRVFGSNSLLTAAVPKPFLFYQMGHWDNEDIAETLPAGRQFLQVFIHDEPASYLQIDALANLVRVALENQNNSSDVMMCRWLETSRDFDDERLQTVFRYVRFQLITPR